MPRRHRGAGALFGAVILAASCLFAAHAGADETSECWRRFLEDRRGAGPAGEIVAINFVGHTFRVPAAYLWRGLPRAALGDQDAIWLMALAPDFAPPSAEQVQGYWRPTAPTLRVTIFGHPNFLHGQALLDAFVRRHGHRNLDGERDANGFVVLRVPPLTSAIWEEIHLPPEGPDDLFHCRLIESVPFPSCTAQRWMGGRLRLEMNFRKHLIPQYPVMRAALAAFMRCAVGPQGVPGQVWPPPAQPNE